MTTVIIDVAPLEIVKQRLSSAFKGKKQGQRITFATHELMWKVLTPKRWNILSAMTGRGALGVREISRLVERDVKGVHTDLKALEKAGILQRSDGVKYLFPYRSVHVDFVLKAA